MTCFLEETVASMEMYHCISSIASRGIKARSRGAVHRREAVYRIYGAISVEKVVHCKQKKAL